MTRTLRTLRSTALCAAALIATTMGAGGASSDPLQLLTAMGMVDAVDRSRVDTGGAVFSVVPARGRDLAVFGVARTTAGSGRLVAWTRSVEHLYVGRYVPAIGRFSDPPQLSDLAGLTLDEEDLSDLRTCRPGDCGVKLSAPEIEEIRSTAAAAGAQWRPAVQLAFQRAIVARAQAYLNDGFAATASYHDRKRSVSPATEFDEIAARIGFEPLYGSRVMPYLDAYPDVEGHGVESLLYWSKETLGAGKPIVSVTHLAIFRSLQPGPGTVVAARQVFATHYLTGSLSLTMITGGVNGAPSYLVYLRRSRTDAFEGTFGKLVRKMVERRIRADAPGVLDGLRRKLEGGDPPGAGATY